MEFRRIKEEGIRSTPTIIDMYKKSILLKTIARIVSLKISAQSGDFNILYRNEKSQNRADVDAWAYTVMSDRIHIDLSGERRTESKNIRLSTLGDAYKIISKLPHTEQAALKLSAVNINNTLLNDEYKNVFENIRKSPEENFQEIKKIVLKALVEEGDNLNKDILGSLRGENASKRRFANEVQGGEGIWISDHAVDRFSDRVLNGDFTSFLESKNKLKDLLFNKTNVMQKMANDYVLSNASVRRLASDGVINTDPEKYSKIPDFIKATEGTYDEPVEIVRNGNRMRIKVRITVRDGGDITSIIPLDSGRIHEANEKRWARETHGISSIENLPINKKITLTDSVFYDLMDGYRFNGSSIKDINFSYGPQGHLSGRYYYTMSEKDPNKLKFIADVYETENPNNILASKMEVIDISPGSPLLKGRQVNDRNSAIRDYIIPDAVKATRTWLMELFVEAHNKIDPEDKKMSYAQYQNNLLKNAPEFVPEKVLSLEDEERKEKEAKEEKEAKNRQVKEENDRKEQEVKNKKLEQMKIMRKKMPTLDQINAVFFIDYINHPDENKVLDIAEYISEKFLDNDSPSISFKMTPDLNAPVNLPKEKISDLVAFKLYAEVTSGNVRGIMAEIEKMIKYMVPIVARYEMMDPDAVKEIFPPQKILQVISNYALYVKEVF